MNTPYQEKYINGLRVVVYPMKEVKSVIAEIVFKAGSKYEGESWGAFHFLEHLTHEGTSDFKAYEDVEDYKEDHGLDANAYTSDENVGFWAKGPDYSIEAVLHYLQQLAFKATFPADTFAKQVSIITQEYKDKWDNPHRRYGQAISGWLYGDRHPYLKDALGQPEYLETITRDQIVSLHQQYFFNENAFLVVVGHVEPTVVFSQVEKLFTTRSDQKIPLVSIPDITPSYGENFFLDVTKQEDVSIFWLLPGKDQLAIPDLIKFVFAKYIIGSAPNALLKREIRQKRGLAYHTSAVLSTRQKHGYFEAYCSNERKNTEEVKTLLKQTVYDFLKQPVDEERFNKARSFMNANSYTSFDSIGGILSSLCSSLEDYDTIYLPEYYVELAKKITPTEVQEFLSQYLIPGKEVVTIMRNKDTEPAKENFNN